MTIKPEWQGRVVVVTGSRAYPYSAHLWRVLTDLRPRVVAHGDQSGADTQADAWAKYNVVPRLAVPARWKSLGNYAGPERNQRMLFLAADLAVPSEENLLVVGFPVTGSKGTWHCMRIGREIGADVLLYQKEEGLKEWEG